MQLYIGNFCDGILLFYDLVLFFYGSWLIYHYVDTFSGGHKPTNTAGEYLAYQLNYGRTSWHGCGIQKRSRSSSWDKGIWVHNHPNVGNYGLMVIQNASNVFCFHYVGCSSYLIPNLQIHIFGDEYPQGKCCWESGAGTLILFYSFTYYEHFSCFLVFWQCSRFESWVIHFRKKGHILKIRILELQLKPGILRHLWPNVDPWKGHLPSGHDHF